MSPPWRRHLIIISVVFSLQCIVLVVNTQQQQQPNTGTAVQLPSLDSVDPVEAENVARLKAELENEAKEKKNAQNVVRLAATDQLNSEIVTNRTRAYLSCESGEMIVKINFSEPFRGVGYSDYDRSSPCKFHGDGGRYYEMRLPLKGCGTKQEAPRIFLNNIIVRFHRSLELEEDEIKTIICRYPPPLAPPPPLIAAPILESPPVPAPILPAKLSEVELLLIVSALLFLTLLLLGIGIGYYCLKRRNIKIVKIPPPPYIPRVSLSSSESDYSESRSILSETSTIRRDHFRFDNMGFMPEPKLTHMGYDDVFRNSQHMIDEDVEITKQMVLAPPRPVVDTRMIDDRYVTNASQTDLDEDIEHGAVFAPRRPKITTLITEDYYITPTTTTEIVDEIVTQRVFAPPKKPLTSRVTDDMFITPEMDNEVVEETVTQRMFGPPRITTKTTDDYYLHPEQETDITEETTVHRLYGPKKPKHEVKTIDDYYLHPESETDITEEFAQQRIYSPSDRPRTVESEDDYYRDTYEIDEIIDDTLVHRTVAPSTTRTIQTGDDEYVTRSREVEEFVDDTSHRMFPIRRPQPKITVKNIDDFYVTKITDTEIDEKIIKTGRSMPNLFLPVDYDEEEETEETVHKISSTGFDVRVRSIPLISETGPSTSTTFTDTKVTRTSETTKIDTILRVIENPPPTIEKVQEHFPPSTRNRLRTIITTDEVFRTLIIESTTVEEYYERIQRNPSYGPLFEPPVWDVIFRIFSLPEVVSTHPTTTYSKDTIKSYTSAHEVRSVTEEDVSFSRYHSTGVSPYVSPPDYPEDDNFERLPNVETYSVESMPPYRSTYGTTGGEQHHEYRYSSVFGQRRLADPSDPYVAASPSMRRRLREYGTRPYSPDIEALSLEPPSGTRAASTLMATTLASSTSARTSQQQQQHTRMLSDEREESKSITETNVYDWRRSG